MTTRFQVGSATDVGRHRSSNQDAFLVVDSRSLYVVADGMGGHRGGETAAAMAVETLDDAFEAGSQASLVAAVELANERIHTRAGDDDDLRGMGTTVCAIALVDTDDDEEEIAWVNVGDSRVYLFRDDALIQLSTDHSLVEDLVREGQITEEEAKVHPKRNIVTRALGIDTDVDVDSRTVIPFRGDRYVLASDGLFGELSSDQIAAVLRRLADPQDAADELVRQANDHGGRDNITVVVADVVDDGGRSAAASDAIADEPSGLASEGDEPPFPDDDQDDAALPFGRDADDIFGDLERARGRHLTWRVLVFVVSIVAVLAVAFGAIAWFANRTYFVGFQGDTVAIYQGQPGGVLFIDPEVEESSDLVRDDLTPAEVERVEGEPTFGSLADAQTYVNNLAGEVADREAPPPTTTTTTTTVPATTTTTTAPAAPTTPTSAPG